MRKATVIVLAGALLLGSGAPAFGDQHEGKKAAGSVSCDQIQAAWDEAGGNASEDMVAKKLGVPVERVKECLHEDAMELEKSEKPAAGE